MSAVTRTATAAVAVRLASRSTAASSSRLVAVRRYATATETIPTPTPTPNLSASPLATDAAIFGRSRTGRKEGGEVVMKKYTGKGFPMIPGLRHLVHPHHPHLHAGPPLRELTLPLRRKGGRNDTGQVVNRAVGGGHRRRLRIVDFYRLESGEHDVVRVEYDPGRSAHIALIKRRGGKDVHEEEGARLAEVELDGAQAAETGLTTEQRWRKRDEVKGGWSYILAPEGLRAGDKVVSYRGGIPKGLVEGWDDAASDPAAPQTQTIDAPESGTSRALGLLRTLTLKPGNVLPLYLIPAGTSIHNISLSAGGRMQLCRAAGSYAQVVAHHGPKGEALGGAQILNMGGGVDAEGKRTKKMGSVLVKLQSGEVRRFEPGCAATVGTVSNKEHHSRQIGKAGRSRWLGQRPRVRGVAMNACDHPHGGGRGKSKGNKHPRSVYGWLTRGKRTRRSKDKDGNKMVVSERPRGKAKK